MKPEAKVGLLFLFAVLLVIGFAFALGIISPMANSNDLTIAYNFAGGIEVGSPVRVMGIKVGKVKSIEFSPDFKMPDGEEVKLKIKVVIEKKAWSSIRADSHFFINLAGVIGEKFLEVSPGSLSSEVLSPGQVVRGEDPPRIDQLISQSYGLAGKIIEMVEKNEGSVVNTIETMNKLVMNLNKLMVQMEKTTNATDIGKLVKNLVVLTGDMAYFTQELRSKEGEDTIKLVKELVWRLEKLDAKALKKFLQEEGIKAKLF
ncbi:MAG: MCE family protein [Bdellovibrionaceae bacterium]|nr:MCE family protein [Pseudobdellovibrionaceae bacterium]